MADTSPTPQPLPPEVLSRPDVRDALARHDFGSLFRLARKWGGISFSKIAEACEIKPDRVGRMANKGESHISTYAKIVAVADGLRIPGHLIGLSPRPWESKNAHSHREMSATTQNISVVRHALAQEAEGDTLRRREFLAASVSTAGVSMEMPTQRSGLIGSGMAEQLRERTARLRRLDDFLGGSDTYPLYVSELESTTRLLKASSHKEETRQALLSVVAEQAQQAGWAAFDSGTHAESERLFRTALKAATDAGSPALVGNSLAFLAYQQVSTGGSGVETAMASCAKVGKNGPPSVRALLFERRAWAHARAGQAKETEQALTQAQEALTRAASAEPGPDWAIWVDQRELQIMTGRCWAELGRPLRAVPILEKALRDFSDTQARDKALYMSWLAHAYVDAGEVEQAASVTSRALQLASGVASVRPKERGRTLLARLQPHRALPEVAELLDELGGP